MSQKEIAFQDRKYAHPHGDGSRNILREGGNALVSNKPQVTYVPKPKKAK